jgi:opacity protein-like surface antigen
MGSLRLLAVAGITAIATLTGAHAADLSPMLDRGPPPVDDFASGWYLRGDVGVGINTFSSFDHHATNTAFAWPASWNIDQKSITESVMIGGGVGFYYNSWLRFDVTGEYRTASRFKAVGGYTEFCAGGGRCFDVYDGHHSSAVFLANAYFELGTWGRFSPFIGAGVGGAYHMTSGVWDLGLNSDGTTGRGCADQCDRLPGLRRRWTARLLHAQEPRQPRHQARPALDA